MKLLHNSKQKYLEVEGVEMPAAAARTAAAAAAVVEEEEEAASSSSEEEEDAVSVSIPATKVSLAEELGLPVDMQLLSRDSLTVHGSSASFYETVRERGMCHAVLHSVLCNGSRSLSSSSSSSSSSGGGAHLCPHHSRERRR